MKTMQGVLILFWLFLFQAILNTTSAIPSLPSPATLRGTGINYLDWSADDTISAIRNKTISTRQYISNVLDHARKCKSLNAFINLLPEQALAAADRIDAALDRGEQLPPLAGLAIVVKDNINMAGLPTTAGTAALQHNRPPTTAPSLEKLLMAGAIVVGKTNLHELSFGFTSTNLQPFAGAVRNPYDDNMIPGGSSGGTAVAIAARTVTCGLGTDTVGSVRMPAALTGIVGYRPSVGNGGPARRYHDDGAVVPLSHTSDTIGPMGRTVAEITLLDSIITGRPRVTQPAKLSGLRLGVPPVLWSGLDTDLEAVVRHASRALQEAGVVLVTDDMPDLVELGKATTLPIALHEPLIDIPAYLNASRITDVTLDTVVQGIASPDVKNAFKLVMNDTYGPVYNQVMMVRRPALQKMYADYFQQKRVDALLFPTTILPAIPIDYENGSGNVSINGGPPTDALFVYNRNFCPGSSAGIPGLSIPAGMTSQGLPVGIEIDGPLGSDEKLLALGLAMEKVLGHLPPPKC